MLRLLLPAVFLGLMTSLVFGVSLEELNQRYKPLPTVPEDELPPMKNKQEPFTGIIYHPGFEGHTWVRFPFVENPGSFGFDYQGRVYVAEANRFWQGVPDLRGANELIRGDFQSVSVDDRAKLYELWATRFPETFFTNTADRIIRLEDKDGNGAADHRTLFSDHFNQPLDGIGFSLLAEENVVYFTCIPNLWKITDTDDDGVADEHEAIVEGFGVRVSFIGHDLHGITRGPDGRLYFSIGDRGYHVTLEDGTVLNDPGRGAIFRCESDGSGFEVFCRGLRNPQELAFDDYGNLFTFDNTGDIGDLARMVYALENSDSGWDMSHQSAHHYVTILDWQDFHPEKSMWVAEKMFDTFSEEQPQWVYPPASHVARGPSGVTYLTGESIPEDLRGQFLLANYRGPSENCTLLTVGVEEKGAGYVATSEDELVKGVGVSDVELGYDGNIYICDFGGGWSINNNGSIQTLVPTNENQRQAGAKVASYFAKGLADESVESLVNLLESPDKRLRQLSQFELVKRGEKETLVNVANDTAKATTTRLHGIWALDQMGRTGTAVTEDLLALTKDKENEIRANAARVLGSIRATESKDTLITLLTDESPRVRSLAAVALGRVAPQGDSNTINALYSMASDTGETEIDPVLRHSAVSALDRAGTTEAAVDRAADENREVRMTALLYLRRHESPEAAKFLDDKDPVIQREAVRAVYDTAAVDSPAGDELAGMIKEASSFPPTVQRRIVAANYRRGGAQHARNLVSMAGDSSLAPATREAALYALSMWETILETDPMLGHYRPLPESNRSMTSLGDAIDADLRGLFEKDLPANLSALALKLANASGVSLGAPILKNFVTDKHFADEIRVAALDSLATSEKTEAASIIPDLLSDPSAEVAAAAVRHGFALEVNGINSVAKESIQSGPLVKARAGIDGLASTSPDAIADIWKHRESKKIRKALWLDVYLNLQTSTEPALQSLATEYASAGPEAVYQLSEVGGVPKNGEKVFQNQGACMQCHKVGGNGGIQGPDLSKIGDRLKPDKLVESLVNPNAVIAEGYGMATVSLNDGNVAMGRIAKETEKEITLITVDGKSATMARKDIASIAPPISAMPPLGASLPPRDLRDLVAYLQSLSGKGGKKGNSDSSHGEESDEKIAK
ncbi:MAG: hypothetical protein CMO55_26370 [Verrucomicrobiales bacterium]|nr:hypothetical protein [Verrucomicrobiales bacterium]